MGRENHENLVDLAKISHYTVYFQTQVRVVKGRGGGICIIQWLRIDAIEVQTTSTQTQIWTFGQFCGFVGFGEPGNETRVCCVHITHVAVPDKIQSLHSCILSSSPSWKCCSA